MLSVDTSGDVTSAPRGSDRAYFAATKGGTNQTGITTAALTKLTFTTEAQDAGGFYDSTNSIWTPPAGKVMIVLTARSVGSAAAQVGTQIYKNGAA